MGAGGSHERLRKICVTRPGDERLVLMLHATHSRVSESYPQTLRTSLRGERVPVTYAFGDFELDEARFELRRHGVVVVLQPKALRLLFLLVAERERAVSAEEVFAELWPSERVSAASIKRAVLGVRRALGESGESQRSIRTVRGYGYQFVPSVALTPLRSLSSTLLHAHVPVPVPAHAQRRSPIERPGLHLLRRSRTTRAARAAHSVRHARSARAAVRGSVCSALSRLRSKTGEVYVSAHGPAYAAAGARFVSLAAAMSELAYA